MEEVRATLPVHPVDLEPFRLGGPARSRRGRGRDRRRVPRLRLPAGVRPRRARRPVRRRARRLRRVLRPAPRREAALRRRRRGARTGATASSARRGSRTAGARRRRPTCSRRSTSAARTRSAPTTTAYREFYAPNVWPDRAARAARDVARVRDRGARRRRRRCLRAMALALELPEAWFVERLERAILTTRAINYERAAGAPDPAAGPDAHGRAHRLRRAHDPARRRRSRAAGVPRPAQWHDVVGAAGNVRVQPRRHARALDERPLDVDAAPGRCRRPRDQDGPVRRRSIARFLDCPPDLVVECIPTCVGPDNPARYEPVVAGRVAAGEDARRPGAAADPISERPSYDHAALRPDELDAACAAFAAHGFAILRGLYTDAELDALQRELEDLQRQLVAGELPGGVRHGHPRRSRRGDRRRAVRALRVRDHAGVGAGARRGDASGRGRRGAAPDRRRTRGCSKTTASASCTRTRGRAKARATRASAGTPTRSRARTSTGGRRSRSRSTSTRRRRRTASCASCPARIWAAPTTCRSASRRCPARSACTATAATCCCTTPTCGTARRRATDDGAGGIRRHIRGGWYGGTRPAEKHGLARLRQERPPLRSTPRSSPERTPSRSSGRSCSPGGIRWHRESAVGALSRLERADRSACFADADAVALGVTPQTARARSRPRASSSACCPNTYRMTAVARSSEQSLRAALLWAGPDAAAAGPVGRRGLRLEGVRARHARDRRSPSHATCAPSGDRAPPRRHARAPGAHGTAGCA